MGTTNQWSWERELFIGVLSVGDNILNGSVADTTGQSAGKLPQLGGLIAVPARTMAMMYENPPAGDYQQYLASLNPIKRAYAQTGTDILSITLTLWKLSRNFAYVALTVVLVYMGLAIMLRAKIDPRTTVTVINTIPKIIIALVMITFSYAIVGFMYDILRVLGSVATSVLSGLAGEVAGAPAYSPCPVDPVTNNPIFPCEFKATDIIGVFAIGAGLRDAISGSMKGLNVSPISWLPIDASPLLGVMLGLAIFSVTLKLVIKLINVYARFFVSVITGPFVFLWGIIPGQQDHITRWFKGLLSAALTFVGVFLTLNIAYFLLIFSRKTPIPPEVSNIRAPGLLPFDPSGVVVGPNVLTVEQTVVMLIVFGIVLASAQVPEAVEDALQVTPSGAVSRAGVDVAGFAKKIPIVGGFFG